MNHKHSYDGFTFKIKDLPSIESIRKHSQLDFKALTSLSTGETDNSHFAKYRGLRIKHIDKCYHPEMFIRGSFPRYKGKTNYQNMSLEDSERAVTDLLNDFGVPGEATEVTKVEYGSNLFVPHEISAHRFINNIITYKGKTPVYKGYNNGGTMILFELDEYGVKIYNKSAQQGLSSGNMVRTELFVNEKEQLQDLGIYTANDLFSKHVTEALSKALNDFFKHLIFYDFDIPTKSLSKKQLALFLEYSKADAWSKLQENNPDLYRKKKWSFAKHVTEASGICWNQLFPDSVANEPSTLLLEAVLQD